MRGFQWQGINAPDLSNANAQINQSNDLITRSLQGLARTVDTAQQYQNKQYTDRVKNALAGVTDIKEFEQIAPTIDQSKLNAEGQNLYNKYTFKLAQKQQEDAYLQGLSQLPVTGNAIEDTKSVLDYNASVGRLTAEGVQQSRNIQSQEKQQEAVSTLTNAVNNGLPIQQVPSIYRNAVIKGILESTKQEQEIANINLMNQTLNELGINQSTVPNTISQNTINNSNNSLVNSIRKIEKGKYPISSNYDKNSSSLGSMQTNKGAIIDVLTKDAVFYSKFKNELGVEPLLPNGKINPEVYNQIKLYVDKDKIDARGQRIASLLDEAGIIYLNQKSQEVDSDPLIQQAIEARMTDPKGITLTSESAKAAAYHLGTGGLREYIQTGVWNGDANYLSKLVEQGSKTNPTTNPTDSNSSPSDLAKVAKSYTDILSRNQKLKDLNVSDLVKKNTQNQLTNQRENLLVSTINYATEFDNKDKNFYLDSVRKTLTEQNVPQKEINNIAEQAWNNSRSAVESLMPNLNLTTNKEVVRNTKQLDVAEKTFEIINNKVSALLTQDKFSKLAAGKAVDDKGKQIARPINDEQLAETWIKQVVPNLDMSKETVVNSLKGILEVYNSKPENKDNPMSFPQALDALTAQTFDESGKQLSFDSIVDAEWFRWAKKDESSFLGLTNKDEFQFEPTLKAFDEFRSKVVSNYGEIKNFEKLVSEIKKTYANISKIQNDLSESKSTNTNVNNQKTEKLNNELVKHNKLVDDLYKEQKTTDFSKFIPKNVEQVKPKVSKKTTEKESLRNQSLVVPSLGF